MKLKELFEGEVIRVNFGRKSGEKYVPASDSGIDIPKGYERFEVKDTSSGKSAHVIGIKKDGSKVQISTGSKALIQMLVKAYNSGEAPAGLQPISGFDAFASRSEKAVKDIVRLFEKPDQWSQLDVESGKYKPITDFDIKRAEKALGHPLKVYPGKEVYGVPGRPRYPLESVYEMPKEQMCIIDFGSTKYLVDTMAANTYIRMWARIK